MAERSEIEFGMLWEPRWRRIREQLDKLALDIKIDIPNVVWVRSEFYNSAGRLFGGGGTFLNPLSSRTEANCDGLSPDLSCWFRKGHPNLLQINFDITWNETGEFVSAMQPIDIVINSLDDIPIEELDRAVDMIHEFISRQDKILISALK